eukprot:UN17161
MVKGYSKIQVWDCIIQSNLKVLTKQNYGTWGKILFCLIFVIILFQTCLRRITVLLVEYLLLLFFSF